jgi:hypothetical protein
MVSISRKMRKHKPKLVKTKPVDRSTVKDFSFLGLDGRVRGRALGAIRRFNMMIRRKFLDPKLSFKWNGVLTKNFYDRKYSEDALAVSSQSPSYLYSYSTSDEVVTLPGIVKFCTPGVDEHPVHIESIDTKIEIKKRDASALCRLLLIQWLPNYFDVKPTPDMFLNNGDIFGDPKLSKNYVLLYDYIYYLDALSDSVSVMNSIGDLPNPIIERGGCCFGSLHCVAFTNVKDHGPTLSVNLGFTLVELTGK